MEIKIGDIFYDKETKGFRVFRGYTTLDLTKDDYLLCFSSSCDFYNDAFRCAIVNSSGHSLLDVFDRETVENEFVKVDINNIYLFANTNNEVKRWRVN